MAEDARRIVKRARVAVALKRVPLACVGGRALVRLKRTRKRRSSTSLECG